MNFEGGATDTTLSNNISVDNGINSPRTVGNIRVDSTSTPGTVMDYDLVYLSQLGTMIVWGDKKYSSLAAFNTSTGKENNGLQVDPLWIDPVSGDFHLSVGSPAVDSANSGVSGARIYDIEGIPRFDDSSVPDAGTGPRTYDDRGAYEYYAVPDTTSPSVRLTLPVDGSIVSGTVSVSADASDDVGVAGVQFKVNGNNLGQEVTIAPYSISWNTATTPNGSYTVSAVARDGAGNTASSTPITVEVSNQDGEPPSVPEDLSAGAYSSSRIDVAWSSSTDNFGVAGYRVYRDGAAIATTTATAYLDMGLSPSTQYCYQVSAYDSAGNESPLQDQQVCATTSALQPATFTLLPIADSYINSGSPTSNYGANLKLWVANPNYNFLIKFNTSEIGSRVVTSARLYLYTNNSSVDGGSIHRCENAWEEQTVTWNNAPASFDPSPNLIPSFGKVSSGTWVAADVTQIIEGGTIFSLRIASSSSDSAGYYSKEMAGFAPQLVITVE